MYKCVWVTVSKGMSKHWGVKEKERRMTPCTRKKEMYVCVCTEWGTWRLHASDGLGKG